VTVPELLPAPPALLAISHGTSSATGQAAVTALVAAVAAATPVPVLGGHVDVQQPDVPAVLDSIDGERDAVLVPLLLSAGYHVHVDLVHEAEKVERAVTITRALGPDDRIVRLLARRLGEARLRRDDAVVLGCAGSSDSRAVDDCFEMARRLGGIIHRDVSVGFISAASPPLASAVEHARAEHPGGRVVISTYLLAPGYFNDLAHAIDADTVSDPLLVTGSAAPPELVEVVLDRYADAVDGGPRPLRRSPLTRPHGA
jgi:sirohydrochlorin ferrochelatase